MELSGYAICKVPISWREVFAYAIYCPAINILMEYQSPGNHVAKEKRPLESCERRLPECASRGQVIYMLREIAYHKKHATVSHVVVIPT